MPIINDPEDFVKILFDYVVVGGGTAGLAVAARLAENPQVNVGVIEAGAAKLSDSSILTPGAFPILAGNKDYDWLLKTVPQVHFLAFLRAINRTALTCV